MTHKNQQGFAHVWVFAAAVIVSVIGIGAFVFQQQKISKLNSTAMDNVDATTAQTVSDNEVLSAEKVKALALSEKPGATISEVELENEAGTPVYSVKLADGSKLMINAQSGKVITKTLKNDVESVDAATPSNFKPDISFAKARELAQSQKPGGTIQKIELEREDGIMVYSVRFTDGARMDVSAGNGAIVKNVPAAAPESTSSTAPAVAAPKPSDASTEPKTTPIQTTQPSSNDDSGSGSNKNSGSGGSNSSSGRRGSSDD